MATSPFGEKILARLYRGETALSRNRNFEAYEDVRVQRAARITRQLESLVRDLLAHGSPETVAVTDLSTVGSATERCGAQPDDDLAEQVDGAAIRISIATSGYKRVAFISAFELALLREDLAVAELLDRITA